MQVLEIKALEFGYTKDTILFSDFNLHIHKGEVITLLGPSGSGKSTLLELVVGNLKPNKGTIVSSKLSQVFQDPYTSFHNSYTIQSQIEDVANTTELFDFMAIMQLEKALVQKKPFELSGGQLQRFSIVRALLMKPDLLLLDEPTSALDNVTQLEVMKLLMQFLDRFGILLITHDEHLAQWCTDRLHRLKGKP